MSQYYNICSQIFDEKKLSSGEISKFKISSSIYKSDKLRVLGKSCPSGCTCKGNKCTGCDSGYYQDFNNNQLECKKCDKSCSECTDDGDDDCTKCPSGYTLTSDKKCQKCDTTKDYFMSNGVCKQCDKNCKTCVAQSTTCTSCYGTNTLNQNKQCGVCDTNNGFFINSSNICTKCHVSCATCNGDQDTNCLSCPSTSTLINNKCITCDITNGYFIQNNSQCTKCNSTCKTCTGTANTNCQSCYSGNNLRTDGSCKPCDTTNGNYIDSKGVCQQCNSSCKSCTDINANNCTSCYANMYLKDDGTCSACTESNFFKDTILMKCVQCHTSCATCKNKNDTGCITCPATQALYPDNSCKPCNLTGGYYLDNTNPAIPLCKPCFSTCQQCSGGNEDQCTLCKSPNLKLNPLTAGGTFQCVPCNTASGFFSFPNGAPTDCQQCHNTCKQCTDQLNTSCITCQSGLYFVSQGATKTCEACAVENGKYVDASGFCQTCNSSCLTCSGNALFCTSCYKTGGLYLKKQDNTCGPCNSGYYISQDQCLQCAGNCDTCSGGSPSNCLTCIATFNLTKTNECVDPCPAGTYPSSNMCLPCHPSCETCSQGDKCLSCPTGNFIFNEALCQQCPTNYFGDVASKKCVKCHSSCQTCDGSTSTSCLTCIGDIIVDSNKSCEVKCTNSNEVWKGGSCQPCHTSCATCSDINEYSCITCAVNFSFKIDGANKICVNCNLPQYFQLGSDCLPCDPSCQTCNGQNDPKKCLTCPNGKYLKQEDNSCIDCASTEIGYYQSTIYCLKCPADCIKCRLDGSKVICDECSGVKIRDESMTQCVDCDITQFYYQTPDKVCQKCDQSCKSCKSGTQNDCLSCFDGKSLLTLSNGTGKQCIVCGEGFYNDTPNSCVACIANCSQCDNNSTCQICKTDNMIPIYLDEQSKCITSCDLNAGFFSLNDGTLKCQACSNGCQSCSSKTICTKCSSGSLILQNNNIDVSCGTCPSDHYIDSTNICKICDSSCLTCSGPLPTNCSTCDNTKNLYIYQNQQCIICQGNYRVNDAKQCIKCDDRCNGCDANGCTSCSQGFYFLGATKECGICDILNYKFLTSSKICTDCNETCQTCSGTTVKDCITCRGTKTKDTNGECIDCQTQNGFYENNQQCLPCDKSCKVCSGPNINQCSECISGLYLGADANGNTTCGECSLEDGYFIDGKKCTKCNQGCKTCDGGLNNQCLSCFPGYFIIGNSRECVECPYGDYDKLNSVTKFSECELYDIVCQKDPLTAQYTLSIKCNKCKAGYLLQKEPNSCISECSDVGQNLTLNPVNKQCECTVKTDYYNIPNKSKNKNQFVFCSQTVAEGYFCNTDKVCLPCTVNCQVCSSNETCKQCLSTHYLWFGECFGECSDDKGIKQKSDDNVCQCKPGYVVRAIDKICVKKLKIESVRLSIQNNNNLLTIILNRAPYADELSDLNLLIDPKTLKQNIDYTIVKMSIVNNQIFYEVNVEQNRRINEIIITLNKEIHTLTLSNTVLTTEEYNKNNKQAQERSENINNASQALVPENPTAKNTMLVLKNFQILCLLSNFIQVLGPIVMLKENIPPQIFTYSILGASFIFEEIPSYEELNYQMSTTSEQSQEDQKSHSNHLEKELYSNELRLLHNLGLSKSLYKNFLFPHLSLVIVTIIVFLNLFARAIMRGKQYTLVIVNILLNYMSNLNQGYITPAIFSIYFSMQFQETRGLAIFQSLIHILFLVLMSYILLKKDTEYIEKNIPNFLENINFKAKGSKSYIIISFIKKYFVIAIFLSASSNATLSCILISVSFFLHGLYILYYRFFQHSFISYYKVFQEFFIGCTFIVLSLACKKLSSVLEESVISNEELYSLEKLSLTVFFMLITCLVLSLILFLVRLFISLVELYKKIQNYFREKKQKAENDEKNRLLLQELVKENNLSISSGMFVKNKFSSYKFSNHPKTPNIKLSNSPNLTSGTDTIN